MSYSAVMNFEKCAAISTIEFTDIQSDEESLERFLQFIADNFDHNEDTTTGAVTTHVMGLISSEYPKSDTLALLPILKQNITSQKMTDSANLKGLIKTYERPSVSKFKKVVVKASDPSQLDTSIQEYHLYSIIET